MPMMTMMAAWMLLMVILWKTVGTLTAMGYIMIAISAHQEMTVWTTMPMVFRIAASFWHTTNIVRLGIARPTRFLFATMDLLFASAKTQYPIIMDMETI